MRFGHASIQCAPRSNSPAAPSSTWKRGLIGVGLAMALWSVSACQDSETVASQSGALAAELLAQNRIAEARIAVGEAIAARDDDPELFLLQGRIELAADAPQGAFDAFLNALALDPANPEALQAVSQLGLQTGHWNEARDATETILTLDPNNTSALLTRGLYSLFSARLDKAEEDADKVLSLNPFSEEATVLKARVESMRGHYAAALAILDQQAENRSNSGIIELLRLEIFRAMRNREGLARQFQVVRAAFPENLDLAIDEMNFMIKTGRTADARQIAYRLLAEPSLASSQGESIIALFEAYGLSLAEPGRLQAVARTGNSMVKYKLATALVEAGQFPSASVLTSGLSPNDRTALLAAIALGEGRSGEALTGVEEVLGRDPDHCLALRVRANARLGQRQAAGALRDAQRAADQCPADDEGWRLSAMAYSFRGDLANARRAWRQGSEANPQDVGYARRHANWLIEQNALREAMAVLRRLTHDAPASVPAWQTYVDLCQASDQACLSQAREGLADARTRYWIDYAPGERTPIGLFGRLVGA